MTRADADTSRFRAGFADPVEGAQRSFRTLLDAMAHAGRTHAFPDAALQGLRPDDPGLAPPLPAGVAATLLTLLDAQTPALLAGEFAAGAAWLRFHTGARPAAADEPLAMAAARAADVDAALWSRLALGSDDAPQDGATLVVEVDALGDQPGGQGIALNLSGPGIPDTRRLVVAGLAPAFWAWRESLAGAWPRGVDLVLTHGERVAALPRSTRIQREA